MNRRSATASTEVIDMSMSIEPTALGFPAGIQTVFYLFPLVPTIVGLALIVTGIYIIVKYKHNDNE